MLQNGLRETRACAAETKFLVSLDVGAAIREWARCHLTPDPHGGGAHGDEYDTSTLYFDNPEYDVFHRRRSFGRSKYRIRRYGGGADVFLERKLRRPGVLSKRRTPVTLSALSALAADDGEEWAGEWFRRRLALRRLRAVCEVSYHRVARAGMSAAGPVRLTLDERLIVGGADRPAFGLDREGRGILDPWAILELKYRAGVPAIFKQLVETFRLQPRAVSKYRLAMRALDPALIGVPGAVATGEVVHAINRLA